MTLPQMMRYTRARNRRFERQRLIQEAQLAEGDSGAEPRMPKRSTGGDGWMPDPNALPSKETVIGALAWMAGGE